MLNIYNIIFFIVLLFIFIEINHRIKPKSYLSIKAKDFTKRYNGSEYNLEIELEIINRHKKMEIMVPDLKVTPIFLGLNYGNLISYTSNIKVFDKEIGSRQDNYWKAFIIKAKSKTKLLLKLNVEVTNQELENIWLDIGWINYGPFGRLKCRNGILISLENQNEIIKINSNLANKNKNILYPIRTHLLGTLDDPIRLINNYTSNLINKNDILTIGETPLAIMQGRYIHPSTVQTTFLAKILCSKFHPTSSLATACGMQTLIDIVGPTRVIIAWVIGSLFKIIKIKGYFYRIAGEQARLIDDITGTTPPYDQTIVLGPSNPKKFCEKASEVLGINIAVVDVNDLGRVKVLAASSSCDKNRLKELLKSNPAGNADEKTPLVLIRSSK